VNIVDVDLNLLVVFEALLAERNVTRAARRLGLTQPAVSNALRRLRALLGDPVFVRTPAGMMPTPRALALGPVIEAALNGIRTSISFTESPLQKPSDISLVWHARVEADPAHRWFRGILADAFR